MRHVCIDVVVTDTHSRLCCSVTFVLPVRHACAAAAAAAAAAASYAAAPAMLPFCCSCSWRLLDKTAMCVKSDKSDTREEIRIKRDGEMGRRESGRANGKSSTATMRCSAAPSKSDNHT